LKLRRQGYVIDPDQLEHPLVQQHEALVKREADLGVELAAWAQHAESRLGGQYVTGLPRALRTSAKLSQVMRERKRLEARMVRQGVMILAPAGRRKAQPDHIP
jgi:hypothetical protein